MPKRLAELDPPSQDFDFLWGTGWCVGCMEFRGVLWDKILIVTVSQDRFKHILTNLSHYALLW
jgi:hypothetical protein